MYPTNGDVDVNGYNPWQRNHEYLKKVSVVMGQKNQLWWDIPASESFLLNQKIYEIPHLEYKKTLDEIRSKTSSTGEASAILAKYLVL